MKKDFTHLRIHSSYSLAEGALKIKDIVQACIEYGFSSIALTDSMNLFGALEFSILCSESGIKPIIGCQVNIKYSDEVGTLILLVQSESGYKNLIKIISNSYLNPLYKDTIPNLTLEDFNNGLSNNLIVLTGGLDGILSKLIKKMNEKNIISFVYDMNKFFKDRFYIELERYNLDVEKFIEPSLINIAYKHDIPLVATNNILFLNQDMYEAHDILLCIDQSTTVSNPNRKQVTKEHYFKTKNEMFELFSDIPEAIFNTQVIVQRCNFVLDYKKPLLPSFKTEFGNSEEEELNLQANKGLKKRFLYKEVPNDYQKRLDEELKIITSMGFSGYFLIVADFIQWAKQNMIPVGPGRGSGAGSLVAWALTITEIDPIKFQLIFERFLNPERVSLPDFDIDFCQERRDEVIRYVYNKYGQERVAHIITFGKMQARAALRDVGRVLEIPYLQVDRVCKLIPNNQSNLLSIEESVKKEPILKELQSSDPKIGHLINISSKLEGLYRHASTHAAGIVIGKDPLIESVPLYRRDQDSDLLVTQFSMKYIELSGLLKFDFLGLKTLTVIESCCSLIRDRGYTIDITSITLDDEKTYNLLQKVETTGIFQLESPGMRDVLRNLRPDRFEDLIALVALYRPGPMDDIPKYLARKHGIEKITYLHPDLEPILSSTYGIMVYQEQVMKIVQVLSGYSLGGADLFRRAMGKKIKHEMDAQKERFISGAMKNGLSEFISSKIFDAISKFSGYGFNKSHSVPYALISYQTAYLKANYPLEFFASLMTHESSNIEKLIALYQELNRSNIPLYSPDVNLSRTHFSVLDKGIRYGLSALKNVGVQAMNLLVEERDRNGVFIDLGDFIDRVSSKFLNKKQLESLIKSGSLDSLSLNRRELLENIDLLLKGKGIHYNPNQYNLFSKNTINKEELYPRLKKYSNWNESEKLNNEFEILGFFLSSHPLDLYSQVLKEFKHTVYCSDILENKRKKKYEGPIYLSAVILAKQERISKNGQKFCFLSCSDKKGFFELCVFQEVLNKTRDFLKVGKAFIIKTYCKYYRENTRLIVQDLIPLELKKNEENNNNFLLFKKMEVFITSDEISISNLKLFFDMVPEGDGEINIIFDLPSISKHYVKLQKKYQIDDLLIHKLKNFKGISNVIIYKE